MKRAAKVLAGVAVAYVLLVVVFESLLGYYQPRGEDNLLITFTNDAGEREQRVLSVFESEGELYLAANHWPRRWFRTVERHPEVHIEFGGERRARTGDYRAVPVTGAEHDQVLEDNRLSLVARAMMGFPPREFVRLDPR